MALDFPTTDQSPFTAPNGVTYTWNSSTNPGYWEAKGAGEGGGASIEISETPPLNPVDGDLWWDSSNASGRLYVWYEDGNSEQWVETSPSGGGGDGSGPGSGLIATGTNPPEAASPLNEGMLWYNENDGQLYVSWTDANSSQWINASPSSGGGGGDTIINNSGGADAWGTVDTNGVNVNGGVCTINGNLNIASVTRLGTSGEYRVVFENAMPNSNYSIVTTADPTGGWVSTIKNAQKQAGQFEIAVFDGAGTPTDARQIDFAVFASDGNVGGYWTEDSGALKPTNSANNVEITGDVLTGQDPNSGNGNGVKLYARGLIGASRASESFTYTGYDSDNPGSDPTFSVKGNGNATFAGSVKAGDYDNDKGCIIGKNGSIAIKHEYSGTTKVFQCFKSGSENASIDSTGSATFAGNIGIAGSNVGTVTAINTKIPAANGYGLQISNPAGLNGAMMRCVNSTGTTVFQIGTNGNITSNNLSGSGNRNVQANNGGTLIIESSDARLKTNVTSISDQTEVVKQLNPVTYNWIDAKTRGALPELGFIAQEVEELVPEIIGENLDGTKVINYNRLTATLTSALQSALNRIETLEAEVQALKGGTN